MASSSAVLLSPKDREPLKCVNDANFAVICAFLEKFSGLCAIEHPNFLDLQKMLEGDEVHADLIDLHVKLLRKLKFSVNVERWERSLAKFCHTYSTNDAWELERFSYKLIKLPIRLRILKNLLETQFDNNPKFKTAVNVLDTAKLRPVPLGRDKMGNVYWRTLDADCNIRIYQENQDEESLRIVASNRDELAKLIAVLSGKEPMTPNLAGLVDEDSSSNSDIVTAPVAEEPKDNIVQKDAEEEQPPPPPITLSIPRPSETTSRITLLGKNNLDKINKFKMLNAKNNKTAEEESEEDEEEDDEDEEEENYDTEDMDIEPEVVSSAIQERVVYIRGEGAGKSNKCGNYPLPRAVAGEEEGICGEAIEEPMMYFSGLGTGRECEGGNPAEAETDSSVTTGKAQQNNRSEVTVVDATATPPLPLPKPMFFFGRPGCLKLSPMKPSSSSALAAASATDEGADGGAVENKKKMSLVAYDDSNSASSNSQESQGTDKEVSGKSPEVAAEVAETPAGNEESSEVAAQVGVKVDQKKEEERVIQSTGVSEESTSETNVVLAGQCEVQIEGEMRKSEKADEAIAMIKVCKEEGREEIKSENVLIAKDQEEEACKVRDEVDKATVLNEHSLRDLPFEVVPLLKRDQEVVAACELGASEDGQEEDAVVAEATPFDESNEEMSEPSAQSLGPPDANVVNLQQKQVIEVDPDETTTGEKERQSVMDSLKSEDNQVDVPDKSCPPNDVTETTSANEVANATSLSKKEEPLIDQEEQVTDPEDNRFPSDVSSATGKEEDLLNVAEEEEDCAKANVLEAPSASIMEDETIEEEIPKDEEIVNSTLDHQNITIDNELVSVYLPESEVDFNVENPAMKVDATSIEQPPTADTVVEANPEVDMDTEEEESSSSLLQTTAPPVCTKQETQSKEAHQELVKEQEPVKDPEISIPVEEEQEMQSEELNEELVKPQEPNKDPEQEIKSPAKGEQEMQSGEHDTEPVEPQEPVNDPDQQIPIPVDEEPEMQSEEPHAEPQEPVNDAEQEIPIPVEEDQHSLEVPKSSHIPESHRVSEEQSILPQENDNKIEANETEAATVASELTVDEKESPVEETVDENESPAEEMISNIPQEIQDIQTPSPVAPEMDIDDPVLPPLPTPVEEEKRSPTPSDEIESAPISERISRSPYENIPITQEQVNPTIDKPSAEAHVELVEKEEESGAKAEGGLNPVDSPEAKREFFPGPTETVPDSSITDTPSEAVDPVEDIPVEEILPEDQEIPAAETPIAVSVDPVASHPEIKELGDNESDDNDGHFDEDFNEPMDIEEEEDHDSEPLLNDTPKPNEQESELHEEATATVIIAEVKESETVINETPVIETKTEVLLDSDPKQDEFPIDNVPVETVPEAVVAEATTISDSAPTLADVVPPPEESVSTHSEPPARSRRGRRSDPVVAALGDTEIFTETPRATRGRANQKESPKETTSTTAKTPPQSRKNSRKRKSSESVAVAAEVETKDEVPQEEIVSVEIKNENEPAAPAEITRVAEVKEEEVVKPIKHESEGDDEEDEEEQVTKTTTTGRKAPAKGKKGRKGRKAPVKKTVPVDAETVPEGIDEVTHVKEEETLAPPELPKEEEKPTTTEITSHVAPEVSDETPKPKKGRRQNRMMGLYVDEIQPQEDAGSVRQSRRIAQIKIKEETDRRIQEEVALGKMKDSMKKKPDSSGEEDSGSEKGKAKGKGRKGKKADKEKKVKSTWHSNSNTSEEDEKDEEEDNFGVVDEDPGSPLFKSDHEFSCESDVDGDEYVPTKMARTVVAKKKAKAASDDDSEEDNQDHACQKCSKHDHPEWILLCDTCDKGYHCSCLIPVLFIIPEGDWYCPQCQHAKLLEQLTSVLEQLDTALEQKEQEAELLRRQAINNVCADNILPEDTVEPEEKRSKHQDNRQRKAADDFSSDEDDSEEEKDSEDSDDLPIYKLRRRKQTKVSYRFNDYDELINKAIGHDMRDDRELNDIIQSNAEGATEEGTAGNLGRGKDISTIMEADDNEKTRKELSQSDASASDDEDGDDVPGGGRKKGNVDDHSDDSEVVVRKNRNNKHKGNKAGKKASGGRKKNRKLNNLDSSSDDDGSDEDFEGSSAEDSEESAGSGSLDSDSSMELAAYRKRGKKNATTRRSGRARVKRFDNDFINDNDDDDDTLEKAPPVKRKKRKKEESDFSDFDEDDEDGSSDDMEEQDLDSADLCDDSESEDSEDRPWGSKKKNKKKSGTTSTKVFSKNPIMSAGKVPRNKTKRKPDSDEDDDDGEEVGDGEKPFKASVPKKKRPAIASEEEEGDNSTPAETARPSRRTRGKKINFLEVVESGSSDDGIKPGVKRPDTPPEEREQFIKRQEEIKKMLAAKNTEGAINAATPKIEPLKLKLSGANASAAGSRQDPNSLSTIPRNIIQSAKALDTEFVKARESGEEFDDELPDDFNPEDMDEEDLDRMMEEDGDFAVQQLKMASEAARLKKQPPQKLVVAKEVENKQVADKNKMGGSLLEPLPPVSAQPPHDLLGNKAPPPGYPLHNMMVPGGGVPQPIPHSVIQGMPPRPSHLPPPPHLISDGQRHPHVQHPMSQMDLGRIPLMPPNMMGQGVPPGQLVGRFMQGGPGMPPSAAGPSGVPQNVIVGPPHTNMSGVPPFPPYGSPAGPQPHPQRQEESPKAVPKKRGRKPKGAAVAAAAAAPPLPPVVAPLEVAMQVAGPPGEPGIIPTTVLAHEASSTPPKKGGGRRKKITPSREELQAAQAASAAASLPVGKREPIEPRGSILSERLEAGSVDPKQAPPPVSQTLAAQPPYSGASVIQRLPQPGGGPPGSMMAGPYPGQGTPPRFYQHQGIGPPTPNAAALGMHHMQPHGNERMHFMQQHPRHMPPHMYRPPSSIYGNPYQGQHAPPPHLQRPQLDPHGGVRPMHPQDYSNAYLPPQFGPYIPGHPPNSHIRGPVPPSSGEDVKGKKGPPPPSPAPGPPHPSQLAHYEALKAAGGAHYNAPYPGPHPGAGMRHPGDPHAHPDAPNPGEFSGLVSYFSAQHDDLEQQ